MPEQKEKTPAPQNNQEAQDAIVQLLNLKVDDGDVAQGFVNELKKINSPPDDQEAFQESFVEQWKQAYIDAGYDIDQAIKLPTFSAEKVQKLSTRLDVLLAALEDEFAEVQGDELRLNQRLQKLDEEIEQALEETDVLTVKLGNEEQTPLHIRPLSEFNPLVKPGQKIDPRSLGMAQVVYEEPRLNLKTTLSMDNPDTADIHEGIQAIGTYLTDTYFPQNKKMLDKFHVKDVKHMTPKQAILLASAVTMERLHYSKDQINTNTRKNLNEQEINDTVAIDQLFQWERDDNGNGVCRNYSAVMYGVFEALKSLQNVDKSLLHNTYVLTIGYEGKSAPGFVDMHAWNGVVSLTDEGVHGMVIDTTWADSESKGNDPAQGGISSSSLDYTNDRFFTLMNKFERGGVLPPASFFKELHESYISMPKPKVDPITEDTLVDRIRELPTRLQMGQRMMQLLSNTPKLARDSENYLPDFFREYAEDLSIYLDNIKNTPKLANQKALDKIVLSPFLERIDIAYTVINKRIDSGKQDWYRGFLNPVLEKYHQHFADHVYFINTSMQLLEVAENARHEDIARQIINEKFVPHLEQDTGTSKYTKKELSKLYSGLKPARREEYRKMLSGELEFEEESEEEKAGKVLRDSIKRECGMWMPYGYAKALVRDGNADVLVRFLHAYRQGNFDMNGVRLDITEPNDKVEYSTDGVDIHHEMTQDEILERLEITANLREKWEHVRNHCSADLRMHYVGIKMTPEQITQMLVNLESYFTDNTRQHLFRCRQIVIDDYENLKDYLNISLHVNHFLENYDPKSIDALLKVNDVEKQEREKRIIQSRRKLQQIEKDPVLRGILVRNTDASNIVQPTKEYLDSLPAEKREFLEKHPIRLVIKDAKDGIYNDDNEACIDKGYPHYFVRSLSYEGAKRVLNENIIQKDGTVLVENLRVSDILGSASYAQIERDGKRYPLVERSRSVAILLAPDRYDSTLQKGDKIVVPDNPIARFNNTGDEIHLFVESTPQQAKQGLEEATNRHIDWEEQSDRAKKLGISIRPFFYESESMNEEHITRTRGIVDELENVKLDVSKYEDTSINIEEDKFNVGLNSKKHDIKYEIEDTPDLETLATVLSKMQTVEEKAQAITREGVSFSARIKDGGYKDKNEKFSFDAELAAMDLLEKMVQGGKYKGYKAEIIDFKGYGWLPDPKEKNIHIDTDKKLISVHIDK